MLAFKTYRCVDDVTEVIGSSEPTLARHNFGNILSQLKMEPQGVQDDPSPKKTPGMQGLKGEGEIKTLRRQ